MLTIKEKLARLKARNWVCFYNNEVGTLSIVRFETQDQATKFSHTVDGVVVFDTWGV